MMRTMRETDPNLIANKSDFQMPIIKKEMDDLIYNDHTGAQSRIAAENWWNGRDNGLRNDNYFNNNNNNNTQNDHLTQNNNYDNNPSSAKDYNRNHNLKDDINRVLTHDPTEYTDVLVTENQLVHTESITPSNLQVDTNSFNVNKNIRYNELPKQYDNNHSEYLNQISPRINSNNDFDSNHRAFFNSKFNSSQTKLNDIRYNDEINTYYENINDRATAGTASSSHAGVIDKMYVDNHSLIQDRCPNEFVRATNDRLNEEESSFSNTRNGNDTHGKNNMSTVKKCFLVGQDVENDKILAKIANSNRESAINNKKQMIEGYYDVCPRDANVGDPNNTNNNSEFVHTRHFGGNINESNIERGYNGSSIEEQFLNSRSNAPHFIDNGFMVDYFDTHQTYHESFLENHHTPSKTNIVDTNPKDCSKTNSYYSRELNDEKNDLRIRRNNAEKFYQVEKNILDSINSPTINQMHTLREISKNVDNGLINDSSPQNGEEPDPKEIMFHNGQESSNFYYPIPGMHTGYKGNHYENYDNVAHFHGKAFDVDPREPPRYLDMLFTSPSLNDVVSLPTLPLPSCYQKYNNFQLSPSFDSSLISNIRYPYFESDPSRIDYNDQNIKTPTHHGILHSNYNNKFNDENDNNLELDTEPNSVNSKHMEPPLSIEDSLLKIHENNDRNTNGKRCVSVDYDNTKTDNNNNDKNINNNNNNNNNIDINNNKCDELDSDICADRHVNGIDHKAKRLSEILNLDSRSNSIMSSDEDDYNAEYIINEGEEEYSDSLDTTINSSAKDVMRNTGNASLRNRDGDDKISNNLNTLKLPPLDFRSLGSNTNNNLNNDNGTNKNLHHFLDKMEHPYDYMKDSIGDFNGNNSSRKPDKNYRKRLASSLNSAYTFDQSNDTEYDNGDNLISDKELVNITVRDLNQKLHGHTKDEINKFKQKRRTLKNRCYAQSSRLRRMRIRKDLEAKNLDLIKESKILREELEATKVELNFYKNSMASRFPENKLD
ncbi:unnamed protein product [Gordionus sp. m RMFG-2023]